MSLNVGLDQLLLVRVGGMHCHKCEQKLHRALLGVPGVHEVEVDFASGQASVLLAPSVKDVGGFTTAIEKAGYDVLEVTLLPASAAARAV